MSRKLKKKETCPKCLGAGNLPGKRYNHPSIVETKKCWKCGGTGEIVEEKILLKDLLVLETIKDNLQRERIIYFMEEISKEGKAIWRRNQNYYMKIDDLRKIIEIKARKLVYHPSAATDLLSSIAVSQNTILKQKELESENGYFKGLNKKYQETEEKCIRLKNNWKILNKLLIKS